MNKNLNLDILNKNDKASGSFLHPYEERWKKYFVPSVASMLKTPFFVSLLTWSSFLWSFLIVLFFYFSINSKIYLWFIFPLIFLQYITDTLDGAVGRHNRTGLIRWGYYTDHFLDFVFISSIVLGYGILFGFDLWIFLIFVSICGFMISIFLAVSTENDFDISFWGIGPTEGRILVMIFHFFVIHYGSVFVLGASPFLATTSLVLLSVVFWKKQKKLWKLDLEKR